MSKRLLRGRRSLWSAVGSVTGGLACERDRRGAAQTAMDQRRPRPSCTEGLEQRMLLAVTPEEYATLRSTFPDFDLPEDFYQVNTVDIAADMLSASALQNAVAIAASTPMPDLMVLRTTDTQNTITYTSSQDEIGIGIPEGQGAITIVSLGTRPLTLDAARQGRVLSVGAGQANTILNLGGVALRNGMLDSGAGGAIYQTSGIMRLTNVTISGNTASNGGGIAQFFGAATLTNVVMSGNTASNDGGAICQEQSTATLTNVTISRNAACSGGGIHLRTSSLLLQNTIVAANLAPTSRDIYADDSTPSGTNNLIGDGSGQYGLVPGIDGNLVGTADSPINPRLAEGSNSSLAPLEYSPVIDAGDDSLIPAGINTDIYGAARIQGAHVNMGAVETVLPAMPGVTYVVTSLEDDVAADGVVTLREALAAANANEPIGDAQAGSYSDADRITFAPELTGTISTNGQAYQISGSVEIVGDPYGRLTIDGSDHGRVIEARGEMYIVSLSGLKLTGGRFESGGGLFMAGVNMMLMDVVIAGNRAWNGAGIYQESGSLTLANVGICDNEAMSIAGGLYQVSGSLATWNTTVSRNNGGGLFLGGQTTLFNTIVAGNHAERNPDVYLYTGSVWGMGNLIGNGASLPSYALPSGVYGNLVGTAAHPIAPMLAESTTLGVGLAPLPGSPAIDAGDNSSVLYLLSTDIYGAARVQGTRVNIGAVETALPAVAATTYVVTSLEDSIAADGVITLREALAAANTNQAVGDAPAGSYSSSDRVEFAPGLSGVILTNGQPYQIQGSVELLGAGADQVILNANGVGSVMEVAGAGYTVRMQGLRLTGGRNLQDGWLGGYGGGLFTAGADLTVEDVEIIGNTAGSGGAICQSGGELALTNVTLSANTASSGGAFSQIYGTSALTGVTISENSASGAGGGVYLLGTSTMVDVTVSGNSAYVGGGVGQDGGTLTMTDVVVSGNTASSNGQGGGLYLLSGSATITNAIISGNTAPSGAGVYAMGGVALVNVTISENVASSYGAGVYQGSAWGSLVLTNVTISRNMAMWAGGGVYQDGRNATVRNSIIAGNCSPTSPDYRVQAGTLTGANNLIGNGAGQAALVNGVNGNLVGTAASPINPMLGEGPAAGIALAPIAGSPAVDAGNDSFVPAGVTTDVYGAARIQGDRVNIGAIETVLEARASVLYVVTSLGGDVGADGVLTLREVLEAANTNQPVGDAPAGSYSSADRIEFAPGLSGTILTYGQAYQILGNVELVGPGADQLTLDAAGDSGVVDISGSGYAVTLRGLKLTRGNAARGGAISDVGAALTLQDLVITGNTAFAGGGVYQYGGTLAVSNVTISGNTASGADAINAYGGGALLDRTNATLTNVTLSDNQASGTNGWGGGVYQNSSTVTLANATITGNIAAVHGGGWYRSYGTLVMMDTTFTGNTASGGAGGAINQSNGTSTLTNVTIAGNTAYSLGGGIYSPDGTHTLAGVTVSGNKVLSQGGRGGGIGQTYGTLRATNTVISGNTAPTGGGVYAADTTLTLTNVVVSGNTASMYQGGGLYQYYGNATLTNVTIAGNTAGTYGGGMYRYYATTAMRNSIVARNTSANHPDVSNQMSYTNSLTGSNNLIGNGTGQASLVHGTNGNLVGTQATAIDPQFVDVSSSDRSQWNLRLQATSPAVNVGSNANIPVGITTDITGGPRIVAGTVDMGAYELDRAPTDIALSVASIAENAPEGTTVGNLTTTDPDAGDTFTYTLVSGEGDADNASFSISGDQLLLAASLDFETQSSYSIRIRSTDSGGLWFEKAFAISVTDVDEIAPTISVTSINDGAIQRSMVKKLAIAFSEPVSLFAGALTVKLSSGLAVPNTTISVANPSGDQMTYVLSFSGSGAIGGSLADGIYDLVVSAAGVQDLAGNVLTADYTRRFHRLFGDSDGNKVVNALDYARLKNTLGRAPTDPLFNSAFDYEGNSLINALDLARFRQRYGMSFSY